MLQGGEQAEQLMQANKVVSPAEEAGYQMPDTRQHPYRYIPPGLIIESSGRDACLSTLTRAAEIEFGAFISLPKCDYIGF